MLLILTVCAGLFAQNNSFSPFVSDIDVEPRNNLIRLTWTDSPDAQGSVYIFRSIRPFSDSVPPNIRPIVVSYGTQYYIDDIDDIGSIYYFIAASDISGQRYDIIIPQTNSTLVNLVNINPVNHNNQYQEEPFQKEAFQIPPSMAIEPLAGISSIRAMQDGDGVTVTFNSTFPQRSVVLYRSSHPVRQPQDLINAFIVSSDFASQFTDFPFPGYPWYYTVIYEDEIASGNVEIRPGINATALPVFYEEAELSAGMTGELSGISMRKIPLPFLTFDHMQGAFVPEASGSQVSANIPGSGQPAKTPLELKRPRIFAVDLEAPATGEESALFQIVNDYFTALDWQGTIVNLQEYLSLPRSHEAQARARFYLGQALYYTGNYRGALLEFLSFRSFDSVEANLWVDAVLSAMIH
jgi:hypothetical protein